MEYTFGVSGRLLRNVLIMYDHQTNSEWSQLRGIALTGPHGRNQGSGTWQRTR